MASLSLYYMGMEINDIFYVIGYVDFIFHSVIAETLVSGHTFQCGWILTTYLHLSETVEENENGAVY